MLGEFGRWLDTGRRLELAWLAFAVVNLAAMVWMIAARALDGWETVPFHFIYVSFTLLYGCRPWLPCPCSGSSPGMGDVMTYS